MYKYCLPVNIIEFVSVVEHHISKAELARLSGLVEVEYWEHRGIMALTYTLLYQYVD